MIKPYYEHAGITIYHGDCREILSELEPVDLVLTDPPYNIAKTTWDRKENYHKWLVDIFKATEKISKNNATLWFFHMIFADLAKIHILIEQLTSCRHKQLIIIDKGIGSIAGRCSIKFIYEIFDHLYSIWLKKQGRRQ